MPRGRARHRSYTKRGAGTTACRAGTIDAATAATTGGLPPTQPPSGSSSSVIPFLASVYLLATSSIYSIYTHLCVSTYACIYLIYIVYPTTIFSFFFFFFLQFFIPSPLCSPSFFAMIEFYYDNLSEIDRSKYIAKVTIANHVVYNECPRQRCFHRWRNFVI